MSQGGLISATIPIEGSIPVWVRFTDIVNSDTTKIIDTLALSSFTAIKYLISIREQTNNKTTMVEMNLKNENGSLQDTIYGKLSGSIDFGISAISNSGNMELVLINNESIQVSISAAKVVL